MTNRQYIGDGIYAGIDYAGRLVLTTENGMEVQNEIVFEPECVVALLSYVARIVKMEA